MKSKAAHAAYMRVYRAKKGAAYADRQAAYYAGYRAKKKTEIAAQQAGYRAANREKIALWIPSEGIFAGWVYHLNHIRRRRRPDLVQRERQLPRLFTGTLALSYCPFLPTLASARWASDLSRPLRQPDDQIHYPFTQTE